jgi:hypothetical protein
MFYLLKTALLILFFSSFSFATAGGPDHLDVRGIASNDGLWMHPTPNYKSKRIGKIPYREKCIKNLGCKKQWCKVSYRGVIGWVNGKYLEESGNCSQPYFSNNNQQKHKKSYLKFTKHMLQGQVLQTQMYGSDLTVKFLPSAFKSYDGDILFHFSTNDPEQDERLSYRLINGKIVFYGNDGSKQRMTLSSITPTSWIILEEEDPDGDDRQFGFGKGNKIIYKIQNTTAISSNDTYDKLYMQIYGRLDTSMASNREYLDEVNKFINTAAPYLLDKYSIELKLHNIKLNKKISISEKMRDDKKKLQRRLITLENLNGKTIEDYEGNRYRTFYGLEHAFNAAGKKSMELQRIHYQNEEERKKLMSKMKIFLDSLGTPQQKKEISKLELVGQKYNYNYYKNILDNHNILLLPDRQRSQKKPVFHTQIFISALLLKQQSLKYLNSNKVFQINSVKERMKKIESQSQELKQQFSQSYLYKIHHKPPMYPN